MYPSGVWDGFWDQPGLGRQPMRGLAFRFEASLVTGHGVDVIGPFVLRGECDPGTGRLRFVKQYLGRHAVVYDGSPDGEGGVFGRWHTGGGNSGGFLLRPRVARPADDAPIREIG